MCLIKDAFFAENNFDVIKMHGTTINVNNHNRVYFVQQILQAMYV